MPDHLGLFLDGSWRLHPDISAYTSEVFYEGRLHSHPGRDRLALAGVPPLSGTGIRFVPVPHSGQSSESPEEVAVVAELVRSLLHASPTHTDASGASMPLSEADVLLITPYNAQVRALSEVLPGFRIGTVDKFQGQEAPISIYSMVTSSTEEAPHGMEFLYSLNRLNVATSRAQCVAMVVASPTLLRVRAAAPRARCALRTLWHGSWRWPPIRHRLGGLYDKSATFGGRPIACSAGWRSSMATTDLGRMTLCHETCR